jgi:SAM-dependent methyltransferase
METRSPQNIYDNPAFFECYKDLREKDAGLNGALEIPALHAQLPDLFGLTILDLGCGFGDFARYARLQKAQSVTALDVSEKMLAEAARRTSDDHIVYRHGAIENFLPEPGHFDLIVSSMALHYVADFAAVALHVFEGLKVGGKFIFTVEHPLCTAYPVGWVRDGNGAPLHWPVAHYQDEGKRNTSWFVDGVTKFHRTVETYVNTLLTTGFRLDHLGEPKPLAAFLEKRSSLSEALRRPPVLLLATTKPAQP